MTSLIFIQSNLLPIKKRASCTAATLWKHRDLGREPYSVQIANVESLSLSKDTAIILDSKLIELVPSGNVGTKLDPPKVTIVLFILFFLIW